MGNTNTAEAGRAEKGGGGEGTRGSSLALVSD